MDIEDIVSVSKRQILEKLVSKTRPCDTHVDINAHTKRFGNVALQRLEAACPPMEAVLRAVSDYTGMYDLGLACARGVCEGSGIDSVNLRLVRFVACGERPHQPAKDFLLRTDVLQLLRWIHVYLHFSDWMTLTIAENLFDEELTRRTFRFLEARVTTLTV
jgi:hypothetical protein